MSNTGFHGSSSKGEWFFISYCTLGNKKQTALTGCIDSALSTADFYVFSRAFNSLTSESLSLWIYDMFPASLLLICSPISLTWTTLKWHVDAYPCDESVHIAPDLTDHVSLQPGDPGPANAPCQRLSADAEDRQRDACLAGKSHEPGHGKAWHAWSSKDIAFFQPLGYLLGVAGWEVKLLLLLSHSPWWQQFDGPLWNS